MSLNEDDLPSQPKYKALCSDMDTVLQSFERAREWADLIKYLQRLAKVPLVPDSS